MDWGEFVKRVESKNDELISAGLDGTNMFP